MILHVLRRSADMMSEAWRVETRDVNSILEHWRGSCGVQLPSKKLSLPLYLFELEVLTTNDDGEHLCYTYFPERTNTRRAFVKVLSFRHEDAIAVLARWKSWSEYFRTAVMAGWKIWIYLMLATSETYLTTWQKDCSTDQPCYTTLFCFVLSFVGNVLCCYRATLQDDITIRYAKRLSTTSLWSFGRTSGMNI